MLPTVCRRLFADDVRVNLKKSRSGDKIDRQAPFAKGRYTVVKLLGSGTYGKVVEAEDGKYDKIHVALKLVETLFLVPLCTFSEESSC
jgi:hypothetical protein